MYDYKMAQMPLGFKASRVEELGDLAAQNLAKVVGDNAVDGFEFYRVDAFTVVEPTGCSNSGKEANTQCYVVTFRRPSKKG